MANDIEGNIICMFEVLDNKVIDSLDWKEGEAGYAI